MKQKHRKQYYCTTHYCSFHIGYIEIKEAKLQSNTDTWIVMCLDMKQLLKRNKAWICHCFTAVWFVIIWYSIIIICLKMNR